MGRSFSRVDSDAPLKHTVKSDLGMFLREKPFFLSMIAFRAILVEWSLLGHIRFADRSANRADPKDLSADKSIE